MGKYCTLPTQSPRKSEMSHVQNVLFETERNRHQCGEQVRVDKEAWAVENIMSNSIFFKVRHKDSFRAPYDFTALSKVWFPKEDRRNTELSVSKCFHYNFRLQATEKKKQM